MSDASEFPLQAVKLVKRVEGTVTHTLVDGIDLSVAKASSWRSPGRPAPESRRCFICSACSMRRPRAKSSSAGEETSKLSENERADLRLMKCGFVFQFHFLLPEFSALENVMLPMRTAGVLSVKEMEERAKELLGMLGLETQMHKRPNQLSGGQRQRVALARALANKPEIIVADEPTGNLDVASTQQVFGILRGIADNGQTVVVVTHDAALAARADRRIHIVDGKIAETTFGGGEQRGGESHSETGVCEQASDCLTTE